MRHKYTPLLSLTMLLPVLILLGLSVSGGMGIIKGQWGTLKDEPLPTARNNVSIGTDVNWRQFGCLDEPKKNVYPKYEWLRSPNGELVTADYVKSWELAKHGYTVLAFCY